MESCPEPYLAFLPPLSLQLLRPSPFPPVCSISPTSVRDMPPLSSHRRFPSLSPARPPPRTGHAADARKCHSNSLHCARVLSLALNVGVRVCERVRLSLKHAEGMVHVYIDSLCCRYCRSS